MGRRSALFMLICVGILALSLVPLPAGLRTPAAGAARVPAPAKSVASVRWIKNGVSVQPPKQKVRKGKKNEKLFNQYGVQTGGNQRASLRFSDNTLLHINNRTSLVLRNPHLTQVTKGVVAQEVAPGTDHRIQTAAALASAIGTVFQVEVIRHKKAEKKRKNGKTQKAKVVVVEEVVVKEGVVEVSNRQGTVIVRAGEQVAVQQGKAPGTPSPVDAVSRLSWTQQIPAPAVPVGVNVALHDNGGRVIAASSEASASAPHRAARQSSSPWSPASINDGLLSTGWATGAGLVANQWIILGFQGEEAFPLSWVVIDPGATGGHAASRDLKDFDLRVSTTGTAPQDFQTIYSGTAKQSAALQRFALPSPVLARYLELVVRSNYGSPDGVDVAEMELVSQGKAVPLPTVTATPVGTATAEASPTAVPATATSVATSAPSPTATPVATSAVTPGATATSVSTPTGGGQFKAPVLPTNTPVPGSVPGHTPIHIGATAVSTPVATPTQTVNPCVPNGCEVNGGNIQVPAGQTVTFNAFSLSGCNTLTAGYSIDGGDNIALGSKEYGCFSQEIPNTTIGPFDTDVVLSVYLQDQTCNVTFYSNGNHANVVATPPTYQVDIADAGGYCERTGPVTLTGPGNLDGQVVIGSAVPGGTATPTDTATATPTDTATPTQVPGTPGPVALANPGFEVPVVGSGGYNSFGTDQLVGDPASGGWTVTGGSVDVVDKACACSFDPGYNSGFPVHSGNQALDLNGTSEGTISQSFSTAPGDNYTVTFWLSGNAANASCNSPSLKTLNAAVQDAAGLPIVSQAYSYDTAQYAPGLSFVQESLSFTASTTSADLSFASTTAGCAGPVLDDVSVTDNGVLVG